MKERRGLFEATLASSLVLHATLAWILPNAKAPLPASAPSFIEFAPLPPEPAPLPKPESAPPTEKAPARAPMQRIAARAPTATKSAAQTEAAPAPEHPAEELPFDFTSTPLSSDDGSGVAMPISNGGGSASIAAAGAPRAPVAPALVALADLSKAPRAPALDRALSKNYPSEARRSGISGSAVLRVRILPDGRVGTVRHLSQSYAGFSEACERTLRSARWEPPLDRVGKRVMTEITYTCRFEVES